MPLEATLIADCPAYVTLTAEGPLPFASVDAYIVALEAALDRCRGQLEILRKQEARAVERRAGE